MFTYILKEIQYTYISLIFLLMYLYLFHKYKSMMKTIVVLTTQESETIVCGCNNCCCSMTT